MHFTLKAQDIFNQESSLVHFCECFGDYFQTKTRSMASAGLSYLKGLLTVDTEKTMAEMERQVESATKQQLGHFISNSPWDAEAMVEEIQKSVVDAINPERTKIAALIIDESSMKKNGHKSVGVKRQYCGALGKVESCQVGVFLAYATTTQTALIGRSLYLPEEWCRDDVRCDDADIPMDKRTFKTKAQLALELVDQAIRNQVPFGFAHMDAHYGGQSWLLDALEERNITFVADIPSNTQVFPDIKTLRVEEMENDRLKMLVEGEGAKTVKSLVEEKRVNFTKRIIRDTERGKLVIRFAAIRVRRSHDHMPLPGECWLLIRQELDGSDTKFSFSNAPATADIDTLAEWQSRRYWVERALQDAKGLAGLDQYRITGWRGWHHHTAMVMLAVLYLLNMRQTLVGTASKLTLKDALEIVKVLVPRRQPTYDELISMLKEKHENRERSRLSRLRNQEALMLECED